jgi:hypothetical protein
MALFSLCPHEAQGHTWQLPPIADLVIGYAGHSVTLHPIERLYHEEGSERRGRAFRGTTIEARYREVLAIRG